MSIKVREYRWHKTWHSVMTADPGYQLCDLHTRGVLLTIRNLVAQTNNNGSIRVGESGAMTFDQLLDYLTRTIPGEDRRSIRKSLRRLCDVHILVERKADQALLYSTWKAEQACEYSPEAVRQRKHREEQRRRRLEDDHQAPEKAMPATASRPPSPPQVSDSGQALQNRDMSHEQSVTCHVEEDLRIKKKISGSGPEPETDTNVSLNLKPDSESDGGSGSERSAQSGGEGGREDRIDIWTIQPVHAACKLCREFGSFAHNTFQRRLDFALETFGQEKGLAKFMDSLQQLQAAQREGKKLRPGKKWSNFLNGIFNREIGAIPPHWKKGGS